MKPVFETEKISQSYKSPGSMLVKAVLGKSSAGSMLQYCFNRNILDNVGPMLQKKSMIKESKLSKKNIAEHECLEILPAMNKWETINQCTSQHLSAGSIRQSPLTPDSTKKFSLQKIVHGAECIVLCSTENACYAECLAAIPIKHCALQHK